MGAGYNAYAAIISPKVDLTGITQAKLTFNVAYSVRSSTYDEYLKVAISTDCGKHFTSIYSKNGNNLATAPGSNTFFIPTATQWRKYSIWLNSYTGNIIELAFEDFNSGGQALYLDNINLEVSPIANFTADTNVCLNAGDSVQFSDMSNSAVLWSWTFTGGSPATSNLQSPRIAYTTPGNYPVSLTVTNSLGSDAITKTGYIHVYAAPVVNIAASPGDTICTNTNATFTATAINAGTSPQYHWLKNGLNVDSNSNIYSTNILNNNDVISCVISTNVGCVDTGSGITMAVLPLTTATLSVTASPAGNVCPGTSVTYTASTNINAADFQWQVNGANVGINNSSYTYTPLNADMVVCIATVSSGCYNVSADTSSAISMTVVANITPTISINGNSSMCPGSTATYTASTNVSGGIFQWLINGNYAGSNSNSYSYIPSNGDSIECVVGTSWGCYTSATDTSNTIVIVLDSSITPTISIGAPDSVCTGAHANYTAVSNVTGGSYQWQVNGAYVGTNSTSYTHYPVQNGDQVSCGITAPASGCYSPTAAYSPAIVMTVVPLLTPTIAINGPASAAQGSSVTIGATINSAGSSYLIIWKDNGTLLNTTTVPTITFTKGVGTEIITATITSTSSGCYDSGSSNNWSVNEYTAGIVGINPESLISIYPNPFNDEIAVKGLVIGDKVCFYDVLGRKRSRTWEIGSNSPEQLFSTKEISEGLYFLHMWNEDGSTKANVVVQKK